MVSVTGRGSQLAQRMIAERRGDKFLADVFNSGGVTTHGQLHAAKVLDPIKAALILPEVTDTSKWYQKQNNYTEPEGQYVSSYVGSATYGSVHYNTKLVDARKSCRARRSRSRSGIGQRAIVLPSPRPWSIFCSQTVRRDGH